MLLKGTRPETMLYYDYATANYWIDCKKTTTTKDWMYHERRGQRENIQHNLKWINANTTGRRRRREEQTTNNERGRVAYYKEKRDASHLIEKKKKNKGNKLGRTR
jgi:hypothetical protein